MKHRNLLVALVLILALPACNLPSQAPGPTLTTAPTEAPISVPPQPTSTEVVVPSQTPAPSETPLPTLTPTPLIPIAWPSDKGVNCRFGPGTEWLITGALLPGQTATITGRNEDSTWWYVTTPNASSSACWVAASVTKTAGNLATLPVLKEPDASVTSVSIKLDPDAITLPGCLGPVQPITITGTIETNGPLTVKWHFETQSGGAMGNEELKFDEVGSQKVEGTFTTGPTEGTFWVRLITTSPNEKTAEAKYKIKCP